MAESNYIYLFSNVLTFASALALAGTIYFRKTGKSLAGDNLMPNSPQRKWFERVSSSRMIRFYVVVFISSIGNLLYQANERLNNGQSGFVIAVPLIFMAASIGMIVYARSMNAEKPSKKKHVNDDDNEW